MIIGVGIDLVDIQRVRDSLERWGERWTEKIFTQNEIRICGSGPDPARRYAARFAAKEAVFKAAGMPAGAKFFPRHIEIETLENGSAGLVAHKEVKDRIDGYGKCAVHISMTHEKNMAAAVAVIETAGNQL